MDPVWLIAASSKLSLPAAQMILGGSFVTSSPPPPQEVDGGRWRLESVRHHPRSFLLAASRSRRGRAGIGFDRLLNAVNANRTEDIDNWPPYDIVKAGADEYLIAMAVAGFSPNDLTVTQEQNLLIVSGQKADGDRGDYLHHGIAARPFERRFELADYVKVTQADLENGLLTVAMKREIPEEKKPRRIAVASGLGASDPKGGRSETARHAA